MVFVKWQHLRRTAKASCREIHEVLKVAVRSRRRAVRLGPSILLLLAV